METTTQQSPQPLPVQQDLPNATLVLVLGILSIVLCGIIGLVLGIISLITANKSIGYYKESPDMYSKASYSNIKAGRTCSIIGICVSSLGFVVLIVYLIFIFFLVGSATAFNEMGF